MIKRRDYLKVVDGGGGTLHDAMTSHSRDDGWSHCQGTAMRSAGGGVRRRFPPF